MAIKILVLGHTGLLGNMVYNVLSNNAQFDVSVVSGVRWPSEEFMSNVIKTQPDYIINCVGAIHQRTKDFTINYELPTWLDSLGINIVHPGTDCESDNDDYGKSKRNARDFLVSEGENTKIIKTSIIGPEQNSSYSLFSWFMSQPDGSSVRGFSNQYWNGNTTLTWANSCADLILNWDTYDKETIIHSNCISKYELLCSIRDAFNKDININSVESEERHKCLTGRFTSTIDVQLTELKKFMDR